MRTYRRFLARQVSSTGEYVPETLSILQTCAKLLPGLDKFAIVARDVGHMGGREAYAAPKSKRKFISLISNFIIDKVFQNNVLALCGVTNTQCMNREIIIRKKRRKDSEERAKSFKGKYPW